METIKELLTILANAIEEGRSVTIKLDDVTVNKDGTVVNGLEITVE